MASVSEALERGQRGGVFGRRRGKGPHPDTAPRDESPGAEDGGDLAGAGVEEQGRDAARLVRDAARWADDLRRLVGELPAIADPRAVATAFVDELVERFRCATAMVYAMNGHQSYEVFAAHGLTRNEVKVRVRPGQPLFERIEQDRRSILLDPLDLAQEWVGGIAGARTGALLAAPLELGGVCHAIAAVGGDTFAEDDLEWISDAAAEAAPGFAASIALSRLGRLLAQQPAGERAIA